MPEPTPLADNLDAILRKYGKIWIWSILAAAVAALSTRSVTTLSMMQINQFTNFPGQPRLAYAFVFLSLATIVPTVATLASVWFLLLFLKRHILPILFPAPEPCDDTSGADGPQLLYRAFAAMVLAMPRTSS